MCMNAYRCNDYEKEPCDIINENSDSKPTCFEEKPLITHTAPVAEAPCSVGLSAITPLDISALSQRIINNTAELGKLSHNKRVAINDRARHYAIDEVEKFLKEFGR